MPQRWAFAATEDLVAGFPRDPDFGEQMRHLLALEQAGHKTEPLVTAAVIGF